MKRVRGDNGAGIHKSVVYVTKKKTLVSALDDKEFAYNLLQ